MTAERAFPHELLELLARDQAGQSQTFGPLAAHEPALAFGERLTQIRKIGERLHRADAVFFLELLFERVEIEHALQMVHAGLQERFAVQAAPEADRAKRILRLQAIV